MGSFHLTAQDRVLAPTETPSEIRAYVEEHFSGTKIVRVEQDVDDNDLSYEVKLAGGLELKFDEKLTIKDIESRKSLPATVVPRAIRSYVVEKFPKNKIIGWERKRIGQKVELDNDIELYFDDEGRFLRSDR